MIDTEIQYLVPMEWFEALTEEEKVIAAAWINYSAPLWLRAGRSPDWIRENIPYEWGTSKDDIYRRYYAGDFEKIPEKPPVIGILDWLKKNWIWVASGGLGTALIIVLARRRH